MDLEPFIVGSGDFTVVDDPSTLKSSMLVVDGCLFIVRLGYSVTSSKSSLSSSL